MILLNIISLHFYLLRIRATVKIFFTFSEEEKIIFHVSSKNFSRVLINNCGIMGRKRKLPAEGLPIKPIFLHFVVEQLAGNTERPGRPGHIAVAFSECLTDQLFFPG